MPRRPDMPCAGCGKLMWRGGTSLPEGQARCRDCRRPTHGTVAAYQGGCRCTPCRAAKSSANQDYIERHVKQHGVSPTRLRRPAKEFSCSDCGKTIYRARAATPLCKPCWIVRRRARERAQTRRRLAVGRLTKAAVGVPANPSYPLVQGYCARCGVSFTRRGKASSYCSRACRQRDRGTGNWITRRERLAIYERDGWICQICLEAVDPDLHYLDDWAASLDHIEPRALALFPDHSPKNLRLSHRWCNSVRGDGSHYTEEVLRVA